MRVYRESEVLGMLQLATQRTQEQTTSFIEQYKESVEKDCPWYNWILQKGARVRVLFEKDATPMWGNVVKPHLLETNHNGTDAVSATYDIDIEVYHKDTQKTEIIRQYNIHAAYVTPYHLAVRTDL